MPSQSTFSVFQELYVLFSVSCLKWDILFSNMVLKVSALLVGVHMPKL
jgi:hypothetical protein